MMQHSNSSSSSKSPTRKQPELSLKEKDLYDLEEKMKSQLKQTIKFDEGNSEKFGELLIDGGEVERRVDDMIKNMEKGVKDAFNVDKYEDISETPSRPRKIVSQQPRKSTLTINKHFSTRSI